MAALVEPLGLERGKRARGPCPPGSVQRPGPPSPPHPLQGTGGGWAGRPSGGGGMGGWAGRGIVSVAVSGCGRVCGRVGRGGAPAAHPCLGVYGDPGDAGRPCHRMSVSVQRGLRCPSWGLSGSRP